MSTSMTYSEFVDNLLESDAVFAWMDSGFGVVSVTKEAAMVYVVDSFDPEKATGCKGNPTAYTDDGGNGSKFLVIGCIPEPKSRIISKPKKTEKYQLPKREDVAQFIS
jgi:hypothetical protein